MNDFPRSLVIYAVRKLTLFNGVSLGFGASEGMTGFVFPDLNLLMFPQVGPHSTDGYFVDLVLTGANDSGVKDLYDLTPSDTRRIDSEVKYIEYFIYGLSGQYAVRDGFKHDFQRGDCRLDRNRQLLSYMDNDSPLFKLYPVEDVVDGVNIGTGIKVMQFTDNKKK